MNIIDAIYHLVTTPILEVSSKSNGKNKMNNVGDGLENFVKDMFAGSLNEENEKERKKKWEKAFSYEGNSNNPPDIMLRADDAIEVKKLEKNNKKNTIK